MSNHETATTDAATPPRWQPLEPGQRRVLGVLIEKAKTTPETYPLSLNSLRVGCNQKSNRAPLMQLEDEQVEEQLESLRKVGAVVVIQGDGRVDKYRHRAYEWLGVEKVELAVMAELLLRGAQTIGELRGRAARMEPIKDLGELRPVLDALEAKRLITYLTPPGRGCVVSHALYQDRELEKVRREALLMRGEDSADETESASENRSSSNSIHRPNIAAVSPRPAAAAAPVRVDGSGAEVSRLREELDMLKREFQAARSEFEAVSTQLRRELDELNRQLGN